LLRHQLLCFRLRYGKIDEIAIKSLKRGKMETKEMYMKVHVKGGSEVEFIAFSGAVVQ